MTEYKDSRDDVMTYTANWILTHAGSRPRALQLRKEFMSKKQPGKIATVMWLSIKELKNDGWVFEIPTTQEVISITCGINISTLQKNLKDFKELF